MVRSGGTGRGDGVRVSTGRTVTSVVEVMEVVVRREAVLGWRYVRRTCRMVRPRTARPPGPGVGVSPGMVMAERPVLPESWIRADC